MTPGQARHLRNTVLLALVVVLTISLSSCFSSDAIATFSGDATKSMELGTEVFDDLPGSVLRRDCAANVEDREFDFKPESEACIKDAQEQSQLTEAKKEREDLAAVQKVLIDYFTAIQQLATFGKTDGADKKKDSTEASSSAKNLKTASKAGDTVAAVESLSNIVVRAFSAGYRNRELEKDVKAADASVKIVTTALAEIIQTDYEFYPDDPKGTLLDKEAHRMQDRFKNADTNKLLLRLSWTDRVQKLLDRNNAAQNYVEALEKIREGHHQLAASSGNLKSPQLTTTIQPYISDLQTLITKLQKLL